MSQIDKLVQKGEAHIAQVPNLLKNLWNFCFLQNFERKLIFYDLKYVFSWSMSYGQISWIWIP